MRKVLLVFLVLFSTFNAGKVFASHYAAVDLYVDYIGSQTSATNKYRVTVVVFRGCEANQSLLGTTEQYCITSASQNYQSNRTA